MARAAEGSLLHSVLMHTKHFQTDEHPHFLGGLSWCLFQLIFSSQVTLWPPAAASWAELLRTSSGLWYCSLGLDHGRMTQNLHSLVIFPDDEE